MRTLFLDFGKCTGYAVHDDNFMIIGEEVLPSDLGKRFLRFYELICSVEPDVIGYEKVNRHLGTEAAHQYGAYEGITLMYSEENGIAYIPVYVMSIKAFVGCAKEKKEDMRRVVIERYSRVLNNELSHNAIDAFVGCLLTLNKTAQNCSVCISRVEDNVVSTE
jgi:Holliday junction resolvasome RuvABC endonuclease subunit